MNDRTYRVESCEYGVALYGNYAPTDDVSALLRAWHYRGLRFASVAVAKRLGALVAVCESSLAADGWLVALDDELVGTP